MSTVRQFNRAALSLENGTLSEFKVIIETEFYGNHVTRVTTIGEAYELAKNSLGTIVTDQLVAHAEELDLPAGAKVLVYNDGKVVGRTASARRIIGQQGVERDYYSQLLREAVYQGSKKEFYAGETVVGLDSQLMLRAHLMVPQGFENTLYSYLLNFQILNATYQEKYAASTHYTENDLYIYADPDWTHPDFPGGLAIFDPTANVAAVLGLRYFGEIKKATLTLAWATAHRNGFVACHGGLKQYQLAQGTYTMAAFGLSGSGKSTITLAAHSENLPVKVLHDDAFVISLKDGSTTALEPAYFDKTQDYPLGHPALNYLLTCQNVGVTLNEAGEKVLITGDLRNGNGRGIKSRYVTPNRVDTLTAPLDAVFWIMKDDSLPPVVRLEGDVLAATFGVTLATKRSTAENLEQSQGTLNHLVIEPFANPFRVYPLGEDYQKFKNLFAQGKVVCYILNTDYFMGNKVTRRQTLTSLETIISGEAEFEAFGPLKGMSYLPVAGHEVDFSDSTYVAKLKERVETRLAFILAKAKEDAGYHRLPEETITVLKELIKTLAEVK